MNGITEYKGFKDSTGRPHDTKLTALIAEQTIQLRAIVQNDDKFGNRQHYTSTEVAELMNRNQDEIAKINRYFAMAIKRERVKGAAAIK